MLKVVLSWRSQTKRHRERKRERTSQKPHSHLTAVLTELLPSNSTSAGMRPSHAAVLLTVLWQLKGNLEAASQKALLRCASSLISVWKIGLAFMLSCQFQCRKPCPALKATHPCETNKRPWHVVPIFYKGVLTRHFYKEQKTGFVDSLIYVFKWLLMVSK